MQIIPHLININYVKIRISTLKWSGRYRLQIKSHHNFVLKIELQWRHNGREGVSNHQRYHCLFNRIFRRRSKNNQSPASLASVGGIHRWPVNSTHKWPVTQEMFPFDDGIMDILTVNVQFGIQPTLFSVATFVFCLNSMACFVWCLRTSSTKTKRGN